MSKYYRVVKENFLWHVGAILANNNSHSAPGYAPLDGNDIWDVTPHNASEYISASIVENCPEYFERVYKVNLLTKAVYKIKAEAQALMSNEYKGD